MLKPIIKSNISDEIFYQLKEQIESNVFSVGSKLPTEKDLCELFNVSRQPIREALKSLNKLGYIESKQGEGTFVVFDKNKLNIQPMNFSQLSFNDYLNLVELRHIIEVEACKLCAIRHTTNDLKKIKNYLEIIEKDMSDDITIGFEADYEFHKSIIEGSKNDYIIDTFLNISDKYLEGLKSSLTLNLGNNQKRKEVIKEHQIIFNAIENRNPNKASEAMDVHIKNLRRKMGDNRIF